MMRRLLAAAGAALLSAWLAGCASDKPKATPLEPYTPTLTVRQAWNGRIDGVQFPLSVAVSPGVFTVAASDGTVLAVQADNGRELWRSSAGAPVAAGVGSDGRFAAVVTRDGNLVTLEAGRVLWRKPLALRVTTAPLVAGERVFVLAGDRSIHAYDALDGTKLWTVKRPSDPLTLSQGGVIAPFKDTLLAGQGPRLAGFDPMNGDLRWEVTVGNPRGTNEVEQLADLVAPIGRTGDLVCVRSFQASVGCVNAERGALAWTKTVGGNEGVAADDQLVFGAMRRTASRHGRLARARSHGNPRSCCTAASARPSARRVRSSSATARASCTSCRATRARRCCASPPTAAPSPPRPWCRARRCWW
jgi:outer membrane protein assembly factor BamB